MAQIQAGLVFGDTSQAVGDLQNALIQLDFAAISEGELSGMVFDDTTCSMLTALKTKYGISSHLCVVEKRTAEVLNEFLIENGSAANINFPLFYGMDSDAVARLQDALRITSKVINDISGKFEDGTCTALIKFQEEKGIFVHACYVDEPTANKINELLAPTGKTYKVSGKVFNMFKEPLAGQNVVAYDLDLTGAGYYKKIDNPNGTWFGDGMQKLGEATSDADGYYEINFHESDFADAEGDAQPDVVCFVVSDGAIAGLSALSTKKDFREETTLADWNIIINNQNVRGESEYSKLRRMVDPFMEKSKLALHQIAGSADQVQFVATETEQDVINVMQLVMAEAINSEAPGLKEALEILSPVELLYGLGRQNVNLGWRSLASISIANIIAAVKKSFDSNIIFLVDPRETTDFARVLHEDAVSKTMASSANQPNGIKNILAIAIKEEGSALSEKFYSAYINHSGSPQEFWTALRNDDSLKDKVDSLLVVNQLSALTGNHVPLMTKLIAAVPGNNIHTLLKLTDEDWNTAIGNDVPDFVTGDTDEEKKMKYRTYLQNSLYAAFPNEKISLMAQNENEIKIKNKSIRDKLNEFMSTTNFDLRLNRLHDIENKTGSTFQQALDIIGGDEKKELQAELNKIQRVFQFSPSPEIMTKLLDAGIDSATRVATMPFSTFKIKFSAVADEATLLAIHQRASHIVSMIEYSVLSLSKTSQSAGIPAISGQFNS
ncbi:MAG TPA: hypothetical protein VFW07_07270 [Parafilimonas sp.]|nr:hypothetical protein [Parafilimonas sp.]